MNNSGEAAEQIVRMSLEGTEIALKLTGSTAKNIAAGIYAVMKNRDKNKLKGKQRLTSMLKSGKELKVFTVSEKHLKQFAKEAKRYGVVYCALRGKGKSANGLVDVMVRAEDASKINRIVERFKLATVDAASIKHDIEKSNAEEFATHGGPEKGGQEKNVEDKLLDDMLSEPSQREEKSMANPTSAKTEKSPPSEPTSKKRSKADEGATKKVEKPSVREELREIKESRQNPESPKLKETERTSNKNSQKSAEHKSPDKKKKNKSKGR